MALCQGWVNGNNGIEAFMPLSGVSFSSPLNGWCVSSSGGRIFKTNDGGATWSRNFFNSGVSFVGVQAMNDSVILAVRDQGGSCYITTNGGASWTVSSSVGNQFIRDFSFISASTGWLLGGSDGRGLWRTTDSGRSWVNQSVFPNIPQLLLNAVSFVDANNGWAVGHNGFVFKTSNGGSTWVQQTSNTTNLLRDVFFINSTNGWAIGDNGTIIRTTNGGVTWNVSSTGATNVLWKVHFASSMLGWAVGENGTIVQSTDGGATWVNLNSGTTASLRDIFLISPNRGWAVGGESTVLQFGSTTLPTNFTAIYAKAKEGNKAADVLWTVASDKQVVQYQVERSTDGRSYKAVGNVASQQSNQTVSYSYTDNQAISTAVYYRVKAIAADGSYKYSAVAKLNGKTSSIELSLYPNPVQSQLQVQLSQPVKGQLTARIVDSKGQVVYQQSSINVAGSNLLQLGVAHLPQGTYQLVLLHNNALLAAGKFVK